MTIREIATSLRLLKKWRMFVGAADPHHPTFAATYKALCAETDDFLGTDNDPPRNARVCSNCGRIEGSSDKGDRCKKCGHLLPPSPVISDNASNSDPT